MFLNGMELWGHIDGSSKASENAKDLSAWETNDTQIFSWILDYMEAHVVNNLRSFTTNKKMFKYFKVHLLSRH